MITRTPKDHNLPWKKQTEPPTSKEVTNHIRVVLNKPSYAPISQFDATEDTSEES
jgi:hypothetical protein